MAGLFASDGTEAWLSLGSDGLHRGRWRPSLMRLMRMTRVLADAATAATHPWRHPGHVRQGGAPGAGATSSSGGGR